MKGKRFLGGLTAACMLFSCLPFFPAAAAGKDNWKEEAADMRQSISIHNEAETELTEVPVLVEVDASQISSQDSMSFYTEEGTDELAYEVESWDPAGTGTVWVKVPSLAAGADTVIWGYYNGEADQDGGRQVWDASYALVEHFADLDFSQDSTGRASGTVTGTLSEGEDQMGGAAVFNGSQKITYGALLSGEAEFTISAVINSDAPGSWVGLAGRDKNGGVKDGDAYFLGINGGSGKFIGRMYNSSKKSFEVSAPFSQGSHLLTLSYDGAKLDIYLDGALAQSMEAEAGSVLASPATDFVLGAYSDAELLNGFSGLYDELQVSGQSTGAELEAFRYSNYFGDAVTVNPAETKDGKIVFTVSAPADGAVVEAGNVVYSGYVSEEAVLSYSVGGGEAVAAGTVPAGNYEISVPLYEVGSQTIEFTARSTADPSDTRSVTVTAQVQDTAAPAQPELEDSSVDGVQAFGPATLSAKISQADEETTYVRFYEQDTITLTEENTVVLEGTTEASLPTAVQPDGGTEADGLFPVTEGEDQTPYQIYRITLTEEQQAAQSFRFTWNGTAEREVTLYVYDYASSGWRQAGSGSGDGSFSIEAEIENSNVVKDGQISLLVWRGMNEALSGRDSYIASPEEYDFNLMWTSDTQFYSETPSYTPLMTQQFQWVIDHFDQMKSAMFLHTGDLVNVAGERAQWERIDAAYQMVEEAGIPYAVVTGNHDQQGSSAEDNANYHEFFPASRLQENNPYWGGTYGDNYYYLMEESGMKVLILAMGMRWGQDDIEWANTVLETYPDYFGILMVHDYLTVSGDVELGSRYSDVQMLHDELVAVNDNIRLILCGHNHGANTNLEYFDGRPVYSVLADYQSLAQGGLGYMRMLKFDVENDLIYVNTYSPYEDSTEYFTDQQEEKDGLYQTNKDEFVIHTELGASTTRTLATSSLKMTADTFSQIGETQVLTGPGEVSVQWDGLIPEQSYTWFAVLSDEAGNETKTETMSFRVSTDRSKLEEVLEEAASYTDLDKYTEESAEAFRTALEAAKALGQDASQAEIDRAAQALREAINGLEEKTQDGGNGNGDAGDNNGDSGNGGNTGGNNGNTGEDNGNTGEDNGNTGGHTGDNNGNTGGNGGGNTAAGTAPETGDKAEPVVLWILLGGSLLALAAAFGHERKKSR